VFADGQCCVKQDDREVRISIEDLAWTVIETPQATLASALMAACMEASVAIVLATRHTPSGLVLPFHSHHRQSVIARLQADAKDFAQEAAPARNGSSQDFAAGSDGAATLKEIARHVEPRDPDNVEARAARFYWSRLFTEFTRDDPANRRAPSWFSSDFRLIHQAEIRGITLRRSQPTTGKSVGKPRLLPKCCHTHAQPTTGKSVGKPRRRNTRTRRRRVTLPRGNR
jgi:hypothetical protein